MYEQPENGPSGEEASTTQHHGGCILKVSIALVSTYPPTICGLASFTSSLRTALVADPGSTRRVRVVRVGARQPEDPLEVVGWFQPGNPNSTRRVAELLNGYDVVVVQHEYGIYGPESGVALLGLVDLLRRPLVVTAHTVLASPSPPQLSIMAELADKAAAVVAMSQTAADRMVSLYGVSDSKVRFIPHGTTGFSSPAPFLPSERPTLLTWGLVGPGKGLEYGIEALTHLRDLRPRYVIAGRTHPMVQAVEGEAYRVRLAALAHRLGVEPLVRFIPRYLDGDTLARIVRRADAVLLPYESTEQVTSGVLVEAVASNVPVIATDFPHARELAAVGAVLTVPHRDPAAIAHAVRQVWNSPERRRGLLAAQRRVGRLHTWERVARQYLDLAEEVAVESTLAP